MRKDLDREDRGCCHGGCGEQRCRYRKCWGVAERWFEGYRWKCLGIVAGWIVGCWSGHGVRRLVLRTWTRSSFFLRASCVRRRRIYPRICSQPFYASIFLFSYLSLQQRLASAFDEPPPDRTYLFYSLPSPSSLPYLSQVRPFLVSAVLTNFQSSAIVSSHSDDYTLHLAFIERTPSSHDHASAFGRSLQLQASEGHFAGWFRIRVLDRATEREDNIEWKGER